MKKNIMFVIIVIFLIALKVFYCSYIEFNKGEIEFEKKRLIPAIVHFERSVKWYLPLNPYNEKSILKIFKIGEIYEEKKDIKGAFIAYSNIRSALLSLRSFYTPHSDYLNKSNDKLENLEKGYKGINKPFEPNLIWSLIMILGIIGWIFCTVKIIFCYFSNVTPVKYKSVCIWGVLFFIFYIAWIGGMMKA